MLVGKFPVTHPQYQRTLIDALNALDPLFSRAQKHSEFEFICTLIRVRGTQSVGWDPHDTLRDVYNAFQKFKRTRNERHVIHFALFLYGLTLEASEPYETMANLLNILEGERFHHTNFPDVVDAHGRSGPQHPLTKLDQLKSRARRFGLDLRFFDEFIDNKLRNAIFHSDYTIYWPVVRILNPMKEYTHDEWSRLVNGAQAYYEVFEYLLKSYIGGYTKPKVIEVYPGFSEDPDEKAVTIIRKRHGVIGLKDNWTREDLKAGKIPFCLGRFLPYEVKMVKSGQLVLPADRIARLNRVLIHLPRPIARRLVKRFSRYVG